MSLGHHSKNRIETVLCNTLLTGCEIRESPGADLKLTGYSTQGRFKNFVIQPIVAIPYTNLHVKESCIGILMVKYNVAWDGGSD